MTLSPSEGPRLDAAPPITHHGLKRFRERMGLPARAARRMVTRAYLEGAHFHEMPAWLQYSVSEKAKHQAPHFRGAVTYRYFMGFLWLFNASDGALVTCYPPELVG